MGVDVVDAGDSAGWCVVDDCYDAFVWDWVDVGVGVQFVVYWGGGWERWFWSWDWDWGCLGCWVFYLMMYLLSCLWDVVLMGYGYGYGYDNLPVLGLLIRFG